MALNAFGMKVPAQNQQRLSPKQVQSAMRRQRQEDARRTQAARVRQREQSRQIEQERRDRLRRDSQSAPVGKGPRGPKGPQDKIDYSLPRGKVYTTDTVKWLNQYDGEERERKEQELIDSLRSRGITTFTQGDGKAAWIQDTEGEDWEVDLSPTAKGIYDNSDFGRLM